MMKQTITLFFLFICLIQGWSQTVFKEDFNNVPLENGAAMVPADWVSENRDGQAGITVPSNFPFNVPQYQFTGWAVTDYELNGEKAVVSTGLNGPVENITDRWLISPKISGVLASSYLFWRGFTDNSESIDNCHVWVTTSIAGATPTAEDFLVDDNQRIYSFRMIPDEFNTYAVDLGAFAGQEIYFAIRNTSFFPARVTLDDFEIKDAIRDDISMKGLDFEPYYLSGPNEIKANLVSLSPDPITSVTCSYQINGTGPVTTETFAVDLMEITSQTQVTFSTPAMLNEGGHDLHVWVETVNGNMDDNMENNEKEGFISIMNDPPAKRVLIQEYTGAWCGWCPAGTVVLEEIAGGDPTFVPVALHSGDQMETLESGELSSVATRAYPSASFDFTRFAGEESVGVSRTQWFDRALERLEAIVPAELEVQSHTYNRDTRELEVTIKTDFIGAVREDLRLNVWIIEEEVTGPIGETGNNGWNNANYDNSNPASPFFNLGPYLEPDEFKHEHVFNASLTGTWGDDEAYPSEITAGESFTSTYNFTLPEAAGAEQHWKAEDIHVVAFVSRYELNPKKRAVLNAARGITFLTGIGKVVEELDQVQISPNPAQDVVTLEVAMNAALDVDIRVFDQRGLEVLQTLPTHFTAGKSTLEISLAALPNGIYFLSLYDNEGGIHTERVVVQR